MLSEKYARILERVTLELGTERVRSAPEPVEEPSRPSEPAEAAPEPEEYLHHIVNPTRIGGRRDDTPLQITIRVPRRAPITPIGHRLR